MERYLRKSVAFILSCTLLFLSIDFGWMLTTYAAELEGFQVSLELLLDNAPANSCV